MELQNYSLSILEVDTQKQMVNITKIAKSFNKEVGSWLRNQSTKDFLSAYSELNNADMQNCITVIQGGNGEQGTWVCREVALEFAQWISPHFKVWCIKQLATLLSEGQVSLKTPHTFAQALKLAYEQQLIIEEQQQVIETQKPKALYFDELVERELNVNFRDTAKELGAKQNEFIAWLIDNNYIYRDKKNAIKPIARHIDNGLFVIKEWKNDDKEGVQTLVTPKGRQTFLMLFKRK